MNQEKALYRSWMNPRSQSSTKDMKLASTKKRDIHENSTKLAEENDGLLN